MPLPPHVHGSQTWNVSNHRTESQITAFAFTVYRLLEATTNDFKVAISLKAYEYNIITHRVKPELTQQ